MSHQVTRQEFLKGAALGAAGAMALGAAGTAVAEEAATPGQQTWSFMVAPDPLSEADCCETIQTEVIVIGAGNAGCAAACACVEFGSDVIVLEKLAGLQGRGGGIGLCNTKFVEEQGQHTDVVTHQNIWIQRCGSRVNEALVSMWFNNGPEAGNWLIDKAAEYGVTPVSFRPHAPNAIIPESYDYHMWRSDKTYEFPEVCTYFAPTNVLYVDSINADKYPNPATYYFETCAKQLYVEDGAVKGVFAEDKDGNLRLYKASKGVILATGGIHDDPEMVACYCDANFYRVLQCQNTPVGYSTGDGIKMALWVGAKTQDAPFPLMLHPQAGARFHGCFPFLNMEGKRFMNEGTWVQGKSMNIMRQTDHIAWSIFDKNWATYNTKSLENGVGGGMFWDANGCVIGQEFTDEDLVGVVENDLANGSTVMADTLEELAELTGIDADAMKQSIARYNELVANGDDVDFHKPVDFLYPVEEGPFYAAKVGVALLAVVGGLSIDTEMRVLDTNSQPIEGLYATGNASGDLYAVDYPINMAGNSNGRCLIWGYLLGKEMAQK